MSNYPNWFSSAEPNFAKYLEEYKGLPLIKFLQIGVFTGDASVWLLENVLTDPTSMLVDVDTWKGSPNEQVHAEMDFEDVYLTYKKKMEPYKNVHSFRDSSANFLKNRKPNTYDFIYIDGDHTAEAVYNDAVGAWDWLKFGGILAFDDYTWGAGSMLPELTPAPGIDKFLDEHVGECVVFDKSSQVWIRKV